MSLRERGRLGIGGKRKCEVVHQIVTDIPSNEVMDQCSQSCILHQNWLLPLMSQVGVPLCIGVHHAWDRCTSPTPHKQASKGSEGRMMPQENSGWEVTQYPASKTSLGGLMGSYDFYHGHPPEHPLRMGEDSR